MGSFKKSFKQEIVTPYQAEFGPYEELCVAKLRIEALGQMVVSMLADSDCQPSPDVVEGVAFMFKTEREIMAGIVSGLAEWAAERRAAAAMDAAEQGSVADSVRKVREAFIGEAAKAGVEPQVIAQAINLRRSSVERVIGQLRGSAKAPIAPEIARAASA